MVGADLIHRCLQESRADLGFAGREVISADLAPFRDTALSLRRAGFPGPFDGNLGTRRPGYQAIARSASPCLSRTLGI
jgi:hypothetical protein